MPRNFMFTREDVTEAALELTRESGIESVTARELGKRLGSSSKPIFGLFKSMDEVRQAVLDAANETYHGFLKVNMENKEYPTYKASGMAYIRFAGKEKELFKLLFMRDRSSEKISENREEVEPFVKLITKGTGISEDDAYLFHIEMWIYVHGIASMIATGYLDPDEEFASRVLTDAYEGLKHLFCNTENQKECN